jgi:hypothetical protein
VAAPVPLKNNQSYKGPAFQIGTLVLDDQDLFFYICPDELGNLSSARAIPAWHVKCATLGNLLVETQKVISQNVVLNIRVWLSFVCRVYRESSHAFVWERIRKSHSDSGHTTMARLGLGKLQ